MRSGHPMSQFSTGDISSIKSVHSLRCGEMQVTRQIRLVFLHANTRQTRTINRRYFDKNSPSSYIVH